MGRSCFAACLASLPACSFWAAGSHSFQHAQTGDVKIGRPNKCFGLSFWFSFEPPPSPPQTKKGKACHLASRKKATFRRGAAGPPGGGGKGIRMVQEEKDRGPGERPVPAGLSRTAGCLAIWSKPTQYVDWCEGSFPWLGPHLSWPRMKLRFLGRPCRGKACWSLPLLRDLDRRRCFVRLFFSFSIFWVL